LSWVWDDPGKKPKSVRIWDVLKSKKARLAKEIKITERLDIVMRYKKKKERYIWGMHFASIKKTLKRRRNRWKDEPRMPKCEECLHLTGQKC